MKKFGQIMLTITMLVITFLGGWFGHIAFVNLFDASNQSPFYAHLIQQAWTDIDHNYVDRKAVNYQQMSYKEREATAIPLVPGLHESLATDVSSRE